MKELDFGFYAIEDLLVVIDEAAAEAMWFLAQSGCTLEEARAVLSADAHRLPVM